MANLYEAMMAVQNEVSDVVKGGLNPHHGNRYATLADTLDTLKPLLQKHGLLLIQYPVPATRDGYMVLRTQLVLVKTGESLTCDAEVPLSRADAQAYGSCMTYARRYTLHALFVLRTVDDDGEAASGRPAPPARPATAEKESQKPKTTKLFPKVRLSNDAPKDPL